MSNTLPKGIFYVNHEHGDDVYKIVPRPDDDHLFDVHYTNSITGKRFASSTPYSLQSVSDIIKDGQWVVSDEDGNPLPEAGEEKKKIHTGGSSDYYKVKVEDPTSGGEPYIAECNDIIEALNLTFAQANIFKAIWRTAAAENLGLEKEGNNAVYDAEKMVFFSGRNLRRQKRKYNRG